MEPEVAVLLIRGEHFNISWPILRELGRVHRSGLKFGIITGCSSVLFNKKSRGLVFKLTFCVGVTHPYFKWLLCLVKRDN